MNQVDSLAYTELTALPSEAIVFDSHLLAHVRWHVREQELLANSDHHFVPAPSLIVLGKDQALRHGFIRGHTSASKVGVTICFSLGLGVP